VGNLGGGMGVGGRGVERPEKFTAGRGGGGMKPRGLCKSFTLWMSLSNKDGLVLVCGGGGGVLCIGMLSQVGI
jgi:hypothetical protein